MIVSAQDYVPSEVARNHIARLCAMGMTKAEIAARAGVSRETVYNLLARPTLRAETERRILAVEPPPPLDLTWTLRGACRGDAARALAVEHDCKVSDLFFGWSYTDADGTQREHYPASRAVAHICAGCEVREQCLDHAIDFPEEWGVWGGLPRKQINEMRKARHRDR